MNRFNSTTLKILGAYLVGGFGILEFIIFIVDHYMLSRDLIDVCLITLLSMIPSVLIFAFYQTSDKWAKLGKFGIPVNFIATLIFLFFLFQDKELGATTTTVTVEDEEGAIIERVIPKSEFRKNAAIFWFDVETDDPEFDWLQFGITALIGMDLAQDIFLDIAIPYDFSSDINESGFASGIGLPLTLKRKIADNNHYQHFISGTISKQGKEFSVKVNLYETRRTKLIAENTFTGMDLFNLADEISIQIKHDLEIPIRHIEEVTDLPISETATKSMKALELAFTGANVIIFENEFERGLGYVEQAIQEDPSFAYAYGFLHQIYLMLNMSKKREQTLELLMKYLYKLPENEQYRTKALYHAMKGNPEKQLAILKMWAELYPDAIAPHEALIGFYWRKYQPDKIISEYERILELDPEQYYCIAEIGYLHQSKGEYETALKYYEQSAEIFPDKYESFTAIGDLYKTMGDYSQAKSFYEKAIAIEPEKISVMVDIANIESKSGNFEKAFELYDEALKLCKTPKDKANVYRKLSFLYELKGELDKSIEYLLLRSEEIKKINPELQVLIDKLFHMAVYVKAGKKDEAFQIVKTTESQLQAPYDKFAMLSYFLIYIELGDTANTDKAEKALNEFEQAYNSGKIPLSMLRGFKYMHGKINEMKSNYERAISNYKDELEEDPTDVKVNVAIGRCYRKLNQFNEAEKYLNKCLKIRPFNPKAHYEIALVYSELGDQEKAVKHMNIALDIWKDADPIFEDAQLAKAKLEEWVN